MSDMTSLPIDRMSKIGDNVQPNTAKVSVKRDSSGQKRRKPDEDAPDDPEQGGRLLDIEA